MMGSGKTSWAIQEMKKNKDKNYIFVTPFLSEIERIQTEVQSKIHKNEYDFYSPKHKGEGKLHDFHELLKLKENVAVTHKLFISITDQTRDLIKDGDYILIIDEAINVVNIFNKDFINISEDFTKGDVEHLLESNTIEVDENGYVVWKERDLSEEYKYTPIKKACQNKSLIVHSGIFVWEFPPDLFYICEEIYIMTYDFNGSIMLPYLQLHNLEYTKKTVIKNDNEYILVDYIDEIYCDYNLKDLITICDDRKLNDTWKNCKPQTALSMSWFNSTTNKDAINKLKNNITNYLKNKINCNSEDIMWTTFSEHEDKLMDKGRKFTRRLNSEENKRYKKQRAANKIDSDLQKLRCFVPCNSRATNIYGNRSVLVYGLNLFPNTVIVNYFSDKGIKIDKERYALNNMIQWVWRSCIRNGEPISIYIPSSRMRTLLQNWIDNFSKCGSKTENGTSS